MERERLSYGQWLRRLRERDGRTAEALSRAAGLERSYVAKLEAGIIKAPGPDKWRPLARELRVPDAVMAAAVGGFIPGDDAQPLRAPPPPEPSIFDDPAVPETVKRALRPFARRGADPAALRVAAAALAATLGKVPRSEMEREWGPTNAPDPDAPDLGDERNGHAS